jgi:histidinol-phosphate phosphatase family protein
MTKKILVIRLGSLGDLILSSATVLNLKISFPDSEVILLTRSRYADIVRLFDGVDRVVPIPDDPRSIDYLRLLCRLNGDNFDTIVDLHGNMRSWLARRVITAKRKVVYPKRRIERQQIVRKKKIPASWPHTVDLYNDCVKQLGERPVCRRPLIHRASASEVDRRSDNDSQPVVVVAPGAAHPNKQWEIERFYEVARQLNQSMNVRILWVIMRQEAEKLSRLSGIPPDASELLIDEPITTLIPVISRAELTIANDSGIAHLSSAVGTPVVALFGPTHPALGFAPRGLFDRVIEVDEDCRPCSLHGKKLCYREERFCFSRISVEQVLETASNMITECRNLKPALFVDRDGTIVKDKHYLSDPVEVELEAGSAQALRMAKAHGLKIVVVSNQSGVARGYHDIDSVERVNSHLLELLSAAGAEVDAVYYCPHHSDKGIISEFTVDCECRKPAAGMAEEAARTIGIDLRRSIVIGDSAVDYNLGRVIGGRSLLVRTGFGISTEKKLRSWDMIDDGAVFDNLLAAVEEIVGKAGK